MKRKACCFMIIIALQIMGYVAATTRPFPSSIDHHHHHQPESPQPAPKKNWNGEEEEMANHRGYRKIGSRPPSCEHKCYGCFPCEPIQVPTISKQHNHFGIQYTNYEPEGWKCKCGPSFYSP